MSLSVSSMDDLLNYLLSSGVDRKELTDDVVPQLKTKGFKKVGDLEDLEESDLNGSWFNFFITSYIQVFRN